MSGSVLYHGPRIYCENLCFYGNAKCKCMQGWGRHFHYFPILNLFLTRGQTEIVLHSLAFNKSLESILKMNHSDKNLKKRGIGLATFSDIKKQAGTVFLKFCIF